MAENNFNITYDHLPYFDARSIDLSHVFRSLSTPAESRRSNERLTENIDSSGLQRQMEPRESLVENLYPMSYQRQDMGQNNDAGRQFQQAVGFQRTVKKGHDNITSSDLLLRNLDNSLLHKRSGNSSLVIKDNTRNIAHEYPEYHLFDNPSSDSEYLMKLAKNIKEIRLLQDPSHQLNQTKDHNNDPSLFKGQIVYKDNVNHQFNPPSQTQYKQSWQQKSTHNYSYHEKHQNYEFAIVNSPRYQHIIRQMQNNVQLGNEGLVQTACQYQEFGHSRTKSQNQNHFMNPNHILNEGLGQRSGRYRESDYKQNGTQYQIQSLKTNHISNDDQECEIVLTTVEAELKLAIDMLKQHGLISFPPPQTTPVNVESAFQEPHLKNGDIQEHAVSIQAHRTNIMQASAFEAPELLLPVAHLPDLHSSTKEELMQARTLNSSTSQYYIQEIDFHYSASQEYTQVPDTSFSTIREYVHETGLQYSANQEHMLESNMNSSSSKVYVQELHLHYSANQEHMHTHDLTSSSNQDTEQTHFISTASQEYELASALKKSAYKKLVQNSSCIRVLQRAPDLNASANQEHEGAPDLNASANQEHEGAPDLNASVNQEHEGAADLNASANQEHEGAPDLNSYANQEPEQSSSVPTARIPVSLDLNEWPRLPHPGTPLQYRRRDKPRKRRVQSGAKVKKNVPLYRTSA